MKAYKTLDAYNFFVSGWVNTILTKDVAKSNRVVTGRINHSQRSRATPLKTRFLSERSGEVIVGHCDCMAKLSEACGLRLNKDELKLDSKHRYYYQVQCQLFVTEMAYCEFVVWTKKDLFVQSLMPDEHFRNVNLPKAITFYKKVVLPEVIINCFPTSGFPLSSSSEDGPW